ncbi:efflux RND transporter periplasmic adaptor subunit [Pseudalkalibacillus decolorationis]|uniref:efflux RND transporter periplasmic adaptor subunit n=1 Tax=Pseudalkalibacillus decolorationis TaxID=163879 RepID=UPI002147F1AC|nr:efflux RND transporter periplasmic adaptor subunit [Pseudalkalibacillus decolorationis]
MNRYIKRGLIGLPVILFIVITTYLFILNDTLFASEKPYEVVTVEKKDLRETIKTTGVIVPRDREEVYYEQNRGEVGEILVQEGDQVSAGTPIVKYQSTEVENQIAQLENDIAELKTEQSYYEERVELIRSQISEETSNVPSGDEKDQNQDQSAIYLLEQERAEASFQVDKMDKLISSKETEISRLKTELENKIVESSVSGIVKKVNKNGSSNKKPLVTITSDNAVIVRGHLSEQDVLLVKEGEPVTIRSPYQEQMKWTGTILSIGTPNNEDGKKKFPIDVAPDLNSDKQLPVGTTVELELEPIAEKNAVAIKDGPIMQLDGNHYVFVVKNGYIDKREVTLGFTNETYQEIQKGLKPNELIIKRPNRLLVDNMEVEIEKKKEKKKKDKKKQDQTDNPKTETKQGTELDQGTDDQDRDSDQPETDGQPKTEIRNDDETQSNNGSGQDGDSQNGNGKQQEKETNDGKDLPNDDENSQDIDSNEENIPTKDQQRGNTTGNGDKS